jgi:hypothetical protein
VEVPFQRKGEEPRRLPHARECDRCTAPAAAAEDMGHGFRSLVLPDFVAPLREVIQILVVLRVSLSHSPDVYGHIFQKNRTWMT